MKGMLRLRLVALLFCLLQISCGNPHGNTTKTDTAAVVPATTIPDQPANDKHTEARSYIGDIDSLTVERLSWVDTLLRRYIKLSEIELIVYSRKTGIIDDFEWDRFVEKDSSTYLVLHIGHDYEDNDGRRFVTDGWVYADTATRQLYEYDLPEDTLKKWMK